MPGEARFPLKSSSRKTLGFRRSLDFSPDEFPAPTKRKSTDMSPEEPEMKRSSSLMRSQSPSFDDGLDPFVPQQMEGSSLAPHGICSSPAPQGISSLITEPVIANPSPVGSKMSPAILSKNKSFMDDDDEDTPVRKFRLAMRNMRSQSVEATHTSPLQPNIPPTTLSPRTLQRRHSASEAIIKEAVHKLSEDPNLIADSSKLCLLPTISGKHRDLKNISHETLQDLINGTYAENVENFHIIDCRYPYEYEGGHIVNAINIYKKNALLERYLQTPVRSRDSNQRFFLIFHCEFSSERGPTLYKELRKADRQVNIEHYPHLYYPEMYLLEGGYSTFYEFHKDLCEPQNYIEMLHPGFTSEFFKYQEDKKKSGKKKNRNLSLGSSSGSGRSSGAFRSLNL